MKLENKINQQLNLLRAKTCVYNKDIKEVMDMITMYDGPKYNEFLNRLNIIVVARREKGE